MALSKQVTISPSAAASAGCTAICVGKRTSDDAYGWTDEYRLSAAEANGWKFVKFTWTQTRTNNAGANEVTSQSSSVNPWDIYDFRMVYASVAGQPWTQYIQSNIVAHFEQVTPAETYTVSIGTNEGVVGEWGSVSKSPNQNYYESGTSVTLTATVSSAGYVFAYWKDEDTGDTYTDATITITVASDRHFVAYANNVSNPRYLKLFIIPRPEEHGEHGKVTLTINGVSQTFVDNAEIELNVDPTTETTPVTGEIKAKQYMTGRIVSKGPEFIAMVRYKTLAGQDWVVKGAVSSLRDDFGDGGIINVFFGCGKALYHKSSGKAFEHNGKLVYCG